jgi:hypothetical protein
MRRRSYALWAGPAGPGPRRGAGEGGHLTRMGAGDLVQMALDLKLEQVVGKVTARQVFGQRAMDLGHFSDVWGTVVCYDENSEG